MPLEYNTKGKNNAWSATSYLFILIWLHDDINLTIDLLCYDLLK